MILSDILKYVGINRIIQLRELQLNSAHVEVLKCVTHS